MSLTKDIGLGILAASITLSSVGCKEKNIEKEETKQTEQSEEKKETINSDSSEQIMVGEIELTKSIKKGYTENKIKCRGTNIVIPDEMYAQFIAEKLSADEFCSNYLKNKNEKKFVRATKPNSLEKKLFTSIEPITLDVVITDVQSDQIPYRNEQGPSPVTGLLGIKYVIAKSYGEELVFIYPKRGAVIKGNATVKYRELKNKAIINQHLLILYANRQLSTESSVIEAYGIIEKISKIGTNEKKGLDKPVRNDIKTKDTTAF